MGHDNACTVRIARKGGETHKLSIVLFGDVAQFPSTSNSREIRYKWGFSRKTKARCRLPFLSKSKFQTERLNLITAHYTAALLSAGTPPPSFDGELVTVLVTLARQRGRSDSHNFSKPIGDWLQFVGVLKDDTNAEIFCRKSNEHNAPTDRTTITIIKRGEAEKTTQALFAIAGEDDAASAGR